MNTEPNTELQTWLVGGAVRDALLGLEVRERDWVVVGATPQAMIERGFVPVGKDFPVFLHPHSHEQYALARTERKTAPGYYGFAIHAAPDVTLHEDLARRDLTINAIAAPPDWLKPDGSTGSTSALIDPFGGQQDLAAKCLRHVSPAFVEDPVRVLRLARFAARFPDFEVAPETLALMRQMVADGELDHLVAERVWQELANGLMQPKPSRMLDLLRNCGALARLLPEVDRLWGVPQRADYHPEIDTGAHVLLVLDMAAQLNASLAVRFACLCHDLGKADTPAEVLPRHLGHEARSAKLVGPLCQRLRVPTECRALASAVAREHGCIHSSLDFSANAVLRLLERLDVLRQPKRLADILLACECDTRGRLGHAQDPYPQRQRLMQALGLLQALDSKSIAAKALADGRSGKAIGALIRRAQLAVLNQALDR